MIAGKLIFQSLAGVVAVGCIGGATVAKTVANATKRNNSPSTNDFYLVSSWDVLATQNTKDLWTNKSTKNYKCVSGNTEIKEVDEECALYSLTENNKKTIDMSDIQDFIKDESAETDLVKKTKLKTDITANKFFLLKTNSSLLPQKKLDASEIIKLIVKADNVETQSNTFGAFTVHAKISEISITGKTDWLIGKVEKDSFDSLASFNAKTEGKKCWKEDFSKDEDCLIAKLSPYTSNENFNFSDVVINEDQSARISAKRNEYYIIKFTNTKPLDLNKSHSRISFYDVYGNVSEQGNSLNIQNTKFYFIASAFALTSTNTPTKFSEVIIIK